MFTALQLSMIMSKIPQYQCTTSEINDFQRKSFAQMSLWAYSDSWKIKIHEVTLNNMSQVII